ncbi:hypothetical protein PthstB1num2_18890 [Parageobacillus thermoglucosidasius]|nr:hypothetical protein PthstB1num2_18890 [Parageobacillus thermoglucosidasius]
MNYISRKFAYVQVVVFERPMEKHEGGLTGC